jgi:hypothetical protein
MTTTNEPLAPKQAGTKAEESSATNAADTQSEAAAFRTVFYERARTFLYFDALDRLMPRVMADLAERIALRRRPPPPPRAPAVERLARGVADTLERTGRALRASVDAYRAPIHTEASS